MEPRAVGIGRVQAEVVVSSLHAVPTTKGHLVGTGSAFHVTPGQAAGPTDRGCSQLDGHLQHFVALCEDNLKVQMDLRFSGINGDADAHLRIPDDLVGEHAGAQRTTILDDPLESVEPSRDILVETGLVEDPSVAVFFAQVERNPITAQ